MADYVYPRYDEAPEDPDVVPDVDIAEVIIDCREGGMTRIQAELEALSLCHNKAAVKRVSARIDEERAALAAVNPLDYSTAVEFRDAMLAVASKLSVDSWIDGLKEKYQVNTFAELKAALTPKEA